MIKQVFSSRQVQLSHFLPSHLSLKFPHLLSSWWHSKDTVPAWTCGVTTKQCSEALGRQAEGWRCRSVGTPGIQGSLPSNLLCANEGLAIPRVLAKTDKSSIPHQVPSSHHSPGASTNLGWFLDLSPRGAQALLRNRAISGRHRKVWGSSRTSTKYPSS